MSAPQNPTPPEAGASSAPFIRARGVVKSFGAVRAVRGVDVDFEAGTVHGLVGANGAGKSTFLNMLGGLFTPDAGVIEVDGRPTLIDSPRRAAALGFSFIWQELALVPEFSGWENMTIADAARTPFGVGDRPRRRRIAREVADRLGLGFSLDRPVRELSVAERGLVAIGRALVVDSRFVSMDEPTAALSDVECERLFGVVRELRASGVAVAYVSHRLDEIEDLCDTVTVFREGAVVARHERGAYGRDDLVVGITGAPVAAQARESITVTPGRDGSPLLEVAGLSRAPRVKDVSFSVHAGEIVGLAGVVGAGRTEVLRLIFGADRADSGVMRVDGSPFAPRDVSDAIVRGVALVPEERRSQALLMDESITFNVSMGSWKTSRVAPALPIVSDKKARSRAAAMVERLAIKAASVLSPVRTLSGGNQQKVVLGRWMSRGARILLLDEPTRGVDVGARRQIWETAQEFARNGGAVVVVSSELDELAVCDRVVVMAEGRVVGEIDGPGATEQKILELVYLDERNPA